MDGPAQFSRVFVFSPDLLMGLSTQEEVLSKLLLSRPAYNWALSAAAVQIYILNSLTTSQYKGFSPINSGKENFFSIFF